MYRSLLLAGVLALGMCTTGCSALKINTSEGESQPVSVGIDDGSGKETVSESQGPEVPPEMTQVTVDLGSDCPLQVQLAMGGAWNGDLGYDSYRLYSHENGAIITVNCYEADDDTAEDIVDKAEEQTLGESGSSLLEEKSATLPGGEYWSFHGILAREEMRAIDSTESVIYGVVAGIADNGRLFKVSVEMVTLSSDTDTAGVFAQMLPTVRIAGQDLESPALS